MKVQRRLASCLWLSLLSTSLHAAPLGTAFTYQGRLIDGGDAATGSYDLQFSLFDDVTNVTQVAGPLTLEDVSVTNGLFTVLLDFGSSVFTGEARWLEIGVRPGTNNGSFTTLVPRQPLAPAPYAINAANLMSFGAQPLDIKANGVRALRLEGNATSPNLIGGSPGNFAAPGVVGAVISGGGLASAVFPYTNSVTADYGSVGGGLANTVSGHASAIGGGFANNIQTDADYATIGGGFANNIFVNAFRSTIGGGAGNGIAGASPFTTISGGADNSIASFSTNATIGGGNGNRIDSSAVNATIGGGQANLIQAAALNSTISGGTNNSIAMLASDSFIGGGAENSCLNVYTSIGGGVANTNSGFGSAIGGGIFNSASGEESTIAGGQFNTASDIASTVGGGEGNVASAQTATISGGYDNHATAYEATVSGGSQNQATAQASVVSGGESNSSTNSYATVGGGSYNWAGGYASTVGGGGGNIAFLTSLGNIASGDWSVVSGGSQNVASGTNSTVSGGNSNTIEQDANSSVIGGGRSNQIQTNSFSSVVGGGESNLIQPNADHAVIGGGDGNSIQNLAAHATVGGGFLNVIHSGGFNSTIGGGLINHIQTNSFDSTIAGGNANVIRTNSPDSTIGGGLRNTNQANAAYGTIPGGFQNSVGGQFAFAAGNRAKANHPGSFVWGDSTAADIASTANNQFTVRAGGGVRFLTGGAGMTVDGTDILTGLNATLLDGLDSTAFSRTNHNHLGQSWSGAVFKGLAVTNTAGAALNAVALEGVATGSAVATYGVVGQSSSPFGAGIWAQGSGGNGTALKVSSGAIQVAGAGIGTSTAVFVHQATAANIEAASPHRTTITNPFTDGNPNAILIVTPNYNPGTIGGVLDPHPIGVFYHSTLLKWQIFHQDFSNMVVNAAFNVLAVKP